MNRYPGLPNQDRRDDAEWALTSGGHDFWSYVDSTPQFARLGVSRCRCSEVSVDPSCPTWAHVRGDGCLGSRSDLERCGQQVVTGSPFCDFHLQRAWEALLVAAGTERLHIFERQLARERISRGVTVMQEADAHCERVYFYLAGHAVKIGRSRAPERRVKTLRSGTLCPTDVDPSKGRLLGTIPGGPQMEGSLHLRFRPHRIVGEWFTHAPIADELTDILALSAEEAS